MSKICLENLVKVFPEMDKKEVQEIVDHLADARKKLKDYGEYTTYVKNFILEKQGKVSIKMHSDLDTNMKYMRNIDQISRPEWRGDIKQAALSLIEETSSNVENAGLSLTRIRDVKSRLYNNGLITALKSQGLLEAFTSKKFDKHIISFMHDQIEPPKELGKIVKDISGVLRHFYDLQLSDLNEAGLRIAKKEGYFGKVIHDGDSILGNFDAWARDFITHYNIKDTFGINVTNKDIEEVVNHVGDLSVLKENSLIQELQEDYSRITKDNIFSSSDVSGLLNNKPLSIAEIRSRGRSYIPKSGGDLYEYLQKWGSAKSLSEMYYEASKRSARDIGLVKTFGAVPTKGYEMLKKHIESVVNDKNEFLKISNSLDNSWKIATGQVPKGDNIWSNTIGLTRRLTTLAYLGKSGITQILDIAPTIIHYNATSGKNFAQATAETLGHYLKSIPDAMREDLAQDLYLYTSDILKEITEQNTKAVGKVEGFLASSSDAVHTLSGAKYMNKVSSITNSKLYLRHLSYLADKPMENISRVDQASLAKFGLTQSDLKAVMPALKESGMRLQLLSYAENTGLSPAELRKVQEKMTAYVVEQMQKGSPVPGVREKRLLAGGTQEGTAIGELIRSATQFKVTALKILMDTGIGLPRTLNPDAVNPYMKANTLYSLGKWAAATTTLGMMTVWLKDFINQPIDNVLTGVPPEKWDDGIFTAEQVKRGFFHGGAALMFGDILYNYDSPNKIWQAMETPALSAVLQPLPLVIQASEELVENQDLSESSEKRLKELGMSFIPGQNWWAIQPFLEGFKDGQINILE